MATDDFEVVRRTLRLAMQEYDEPTRETYEAAKEALARIEARLKEAESLHCEMCEKDKPIEEAVFRCESCRAEFGPHEDDSERVAALLVEGTQLRAFKSYVHGRLDKAGVPVDPESPHKAAGCRIGGRLDVLLVERDALRAQVAKLREALDWAQSILHGRVCTPGSHEPVCAQARIALEETGGGE